MNVNWLKVLQGYLWMICAFHLLIGVGVNVSNDFPRLAATWYGAENVELTPPLLALLKPLGAFMIILGALAAVAALDPLRHRAIVYGLAALLTLRALQRLAFWDDYYGAFGIPWGRSMANMAFFLLLGVGLFALHRYVESRAGAAPAEKPNA